jgi:hypothetical protein
MGKKRIYVVMSRKDVPLALVRAKTPAQAAAHVVYARQATAEDMVAMLPKFTVLEAGPAETWPEVDDKTLQMFADEQQGKQAEAAKDDVNPDQQV